MTRVSLVTRGLLGLCLAAGVLSAPARAELVLSQLIVELRAGREIRKDIEVWNNSDERAYVLVSPAEVVNAGLSTETRSEKSDPERLGLLVAPNRMILEPGQHKLIRIASIGSSVDRERVYRVTVKPVVGGAADGQSGLKVLVGYDVLVLVRPTNLVRRVFGRRDGDVLTVWNEGNASAELVNGRQCDAQRKNCVELPGKRIYAGAAWQQPIRSNYPIEYIVKIVGETIPVRF